MRHTLTKVLHKLGLEADFPDRNILDDHILDKVYGKIFVDRASIIDLTTARYNVYLELGIAIGLNRPVLLLLRRDATVPELLSNFVRVRYSDYASLERDLADKVEPWLEKSLRDQPGTDICRFLNIKQCPHLRRGIPENR